MHSLTLTPPARTQKATIITIDAGIRRTVSDFLTTESRPVILFDAAVATIAEETAATLLQPIMISVVSGDASKSLAEVERIAAEMLKAGCNRSSTLICVGGGMLTDIGGFVASIFMRGIPCIHIPTSMLGMVDASIGGKTAVNSADRKNMLGTINHPTAVIIDLDLLGTLPRKQLCEGLAEVIKIAAMLDDSFFAWLEAHLDAVLTLDPEALEHCVSKAVETKVRIVEKDTDDRDVRLLLNFGHTVGHAVEALSEYRLSHGESISIGMVAELRIAGSIDTRIEALLKKIDMPSTMPHDMSREDLWQIMLSDKKNEGNIVKAAVPEEIGKGVLVTIEKDAFLSLRS